MAASELHIPLKSTTADGPINRQQRRPGRHRTPSRVTKSRGISSPKIEAHHIVDDRPKQAETPAFRNRVDLEGKHKGWFMLFPQANLRRYHERHTDRSPAIRSPRLIKQSHEV